MSPRLNDPVDRRVNRPQIVHGRCHPRAWARSESDAVENAEWARKFRGLLENSPGLNEHLYWTALSAAEFRLAPKSEYPKLRAQVAKDLARLEKTPEPWSGRMLGDLTTGYNLKDRPQDAERMDHRFNPDAERSKRTMSSPQRRTGAPI
jgi:hypothetical protein